MNSAIYKTLLRPLSWLPFRALYMMSDVTAFTLRHIIRYRRKVVKTNLGAAFKGMHKRDLHRIEKKFYRNFTDSFFETAKLLNISDDEMRSRVSFEGLDIIDRMLDSGRSVTVYFAHTFNWEWAPSVTLFARHRPDDKVEYGQVYRPLRSAGFDALMLELRSRFGSVSYPKEQVLRRLIEARDRGQLTVTGFMSDQHPGHGDPGHITNLLGIPTRMISGTETLARKLGTGVVYWDVVRMGRGRYKIITRLLAENAADTRPGELTEAYTRRLEHTILRDPALWLWTHKRWKNHI